MACFATWLKPASVCPSLGEKVLPRLPILIAPDPRLKRRAEPVVRTDKALFRLADDMLETMYESAGVGLAAPQVGILQRVIVADVTSKDSEPNPIIMVNPEIVSTGDEEIATEEGCLSLPGQFADVERPERVTVRYLDTEGHEQVRELSGLESVCVQHEIDHLEGVLFVDRIGRFRRDRIFEKLVKAKRMGRLEQAHSRERTAA